MFKPTRAIGIDIGTECAKVVVLHPVAGKLQVAGTGAAALPEGGATDDAAAMGRAIRKALDEAGVRGRVDAVCGLPRQAVATRVLKLPGAPSERLARAAVLEAARALPFPPSEVVGGAGLHAVEGGEESAAVVAAARSDVAGAYRAAAAAAGVSLAGLGVSSLAAANVGEAPAGTWVLLEIGAQATTIDVHSEGILKTARVALLGGERLTQAFASDLGCDTTTAEERKCRQGLAAAEPTGSGGEPAPGSSEVDAWVESLVAEIRLLLSAHTAQGGALPAVVRLAGGGGQLPGLAARLERSLAIPVEMLPLPELAARGVRGPQQYAAAYGLALMAAGRGGSVDLLGAEVREERAGRRKQTRRWALAGACAIALAYGGTFAYRTVGETRQATRERASVAREAEKSRNLQRSLESRKQTLGAREQALRSALMPATPWVSVLDEVAARAPRGVWLTGIEVERGKPMVVRGTALDPNQAADLTNALAASPVLEQVRLSYANEADLSNRKVTQFGITALVRGNVAEAKPTVTRTRTRPKAAAEEKPE